LPPPEHNTPFAIVLSVAAQPMVLLLLACTLLYATLGSLFESAALGLSVVAVAVISVYQELRTQRVLEALGELSSPRSTVVRDGVVKRIASQELVPGDRLACDALLVQSHSMRVDESLLTGESIPVDKDGTAPNSPSARLHAGTLVDVAMVTETGVHTAIGKIGKSMASVPPRSSRLHRELTHLVRGVAVLALLICGLAALVFAWREGSWTAGLLVGLTLAMSIVPEEFAVVWTVMLALGAWRLAQAQVLTRQPQAIETLGTTTVLCVDETGTLTCNRMEVTALHNGETGALRGQGNAVSAEFESLLQTAALASVKEGIEPMDQAIFRLLSAPELLTDAARLERREGVVPGRPFMRQCWRVDGDGRLLIVVKGAPEAVLARCVGESTRLQRLAEQAESWARQGLRVIAVARARSPDGVATPEAGYEAVGLVAFQDPLRDDVARALQECRRAGVRVVMITGDAAATALAIARDAGLVEGEGGDEVLTAFTWLVTVDPHLHRIPSLDAIYRIPMEAVSSAPAIAAWVQAQVERPHLVGPDEESMQWVSEVAALAGCPYTVLRKHRSGDRSVELTLPDLRALRGRTPVLVDDIISSGQTMAATTGKLRAEGLAAPAAGPPATI
jgi:Ca2+-transporting ATPase